MGPLFKPAPSLSRPALAAILLLVALGAVLRIIAAQGGLWIDEAWSVIFADEAVPVLGVFASIHHDNNHHLNTIWLQLVGMSAPSFIMRGLSIMSGTATIWIAALIGAQRGATTAIVAAMLFALSPMLILYGSEARGYAPMLLCLAIALLVMVRADDAPEAAFPAPTMARVALLGAMAHLMMAPAMALLAAWRGLVLWRRHGFVPAFKQALADMGPSLFMVTLIVGLVVGGAQALAGGMGVGSFTPFSLHYFNLAMGELVTMVTGAGPFAATSLAGFLAILVLCALRPRALVPLFVLLALALPVLVLIFQPGNSQFSRYYLMSAIGLLLLGATQIGALIDAKGGWRFVGIIALIGFATGAMLQFGEMLGVGRGHPERPVALLAKKLPKGARLLIDHHRAQAVLRVSAAQAGYPLTLQIGDCAPVDAWFIERERGDVNEPVAPIRTRCGIRWQIIGHADAIGPSGQSWSLYLPATITR